MLLAGHVSKLHFEVRIMPEIDYEALAQRKTIKGMKELNKRCFCGKMKVNHTVQEANTCKSTMKTDTVGRIATDKEIQNMVPKKI